MEKIKKHLRTKYFTLKELRISIAFMVLWAIFAVAFFTYIAIQLGDKMRQNPFYIVLVFLGYASIVTLLSMFFAHRFLGPFERLKTELKIILAGEYHRRLHVRNRDDFYIRSFIIEVNRLIGRFEIVNKRKVKSLESIQSDLWEIQALIGKEDVPRHELEQKMSALHKKISGYLNEH